MRVQLGHPPTSHALDVGEPAFTRIEGRRLVARTVGGQQFQRADVRAMYLAYVYATGRSNPVIETAIEKEKEILNAALNEAVCYEVRVGRNWGANLEIIGGILRTHGVPG